MTGTADELAQRLTAEVTRTESELAEIDLLIGQARTEASRHEARRVAALEKLGDGTAADADALKNLATVTRRAALMEAQVEVLEAKRKAIVRLRDTIAEHAEAIRAIGAADGEAPAPAEDAAAAAAGAGSQMVHAALEDLRREIARAMHDGPAQSLTNIVLQAQIVERLVAKDPAAASREVAQLVGMVEQTLEATKTFIFDVRPMVLDDLGLVPTLRRAARERGRRAGAAVDFESLGAERRLPVDLESALFRTLDDALVAYLAAGAERASLRLDWGEELLVAVSAFRAPATVADPDLPDSSGLPPALAEMVETRRRAHADAVEAARLNAVVALPSGAARDAMGRAATHGYTAELSPEGDRLTLRVAIAAIPGG